MTNTERYSGLQIALHWLIFLLFAVNYVVSDDMGKALRKLKELDGGAEAAGVTVQLHVWVGIAVLALTVIRLGLRFARGVPGLPAGHPLMNRLAHWGHLALYLLLILLPVSGIMAWFGGVEEAGEAHEVLVNVTLILIIVHATAALFHQYVLKDNLLARMRP